MITSQTIEQHTKEFLERGGSINVIDGFKEVQLERNMERVVSKKKKRGIGRALNSANEKSRAERESRVKAVCEMIEKNSKLSFRDLQKDISRTYNISIQAANSYIRDARGMEND